MADFTINSRAQTAVASTDSFLKSDTNGALTRATIAEIKTAALGDTSIASIGDGSVTSAIAYNNSQIRKNMVLSSGQISVAFSGGVGTLSVDLSAWTGLVDVYSISAIFTVYANEYGVIGGITADTLSAYTWKLRTVGSSYTGNLTIRYIILGKVNT